MKKIYLVAIVALLGVCVAVIVSPYTSTDPDKVWIQATRLVDNGETEKAIALMDRLLEKDPELTDAILRRGIYRWELNDASAITDFDRLIELDDYNAYYWQLRGDYHQALEQHDKALANYGHVIDMLTDPMWQMRRTTAGKVDSWREPDILRDVVVARIKSAFYVGDLELAAQDVDRALTQEGVSSTILREILFLRACILCLQGADRKLVCADLAQVVDVQDPVLLDEFEEITGVRIAAEELLR